MMNTHLYRTVLTTSALLALMLGGYAQAEKPNILIIFTDDQGYADLGCYGNQKNKTPRMDQLAREGTRFTSFYAQSVCGPSRSALLTGRYPIRSKGWAMPASEITFAELIRNVGYQTACIGKWDVSNRKAIIEDAVGGFSGDAWSAEVEKRSVIINHDLVNGFAR